MKRIVILFAAMAFALPALASPPLLNDGSFDAAARGKLLFVDFYADWCGPCRSFAPTFTAVAAKLPNLHFVKVDTDNSPQLSSRYNIEYIPYIVALRDGKLVEQYKGDRSAADFEAWCRKIAGVAANTTTEPAVRPEPARLPRSLSVYSDGNSVSIAPWEGALEKKLPIVNEYKGKDGVYIAVYSRQKAGSIYPVGGGIYVMGLIRVKGTWQGRIAIPQGTAGKDISAMPRFKRLANRHFPACRNAGWVGGDTGGFFGKG